MRRRAPLSKLALWSALALLSLCAGARAADGPLPAAGGSASGSGSSPGSGTDSAVTTHPASWAALAPESVWINPGFFSEHFNQSLGYRQDNWGFGAQVNLPNDLALLGGEFLNSDNTRSHDIGVLWQPWSLGPFKIGAVAGAFNGYPHYQNGAWFPAVLPMVSTHYGIVGANFSVVPNYGNRLHGAFVIQLLLRVW